MPGCTCIFFMYELYVRVPVRCDINASVWGSGRLDSGAQMFCIIQQVFFHDLGGHLGLVTAVEGNFEDEYMLNNDMLYCTFAYNDTTALMYFDTGWLCLYIYLSMDNVSHFAWKIKQNISGVISLNLTHFWNRLLWSNTPLDIVVCIFSLPFLAKMTSKYCNILTWFGLIIPVKKNIWCICSTMLLPETSCMNLFYKPRMITTRLSAIY